MANKLYSKFKKFLKNNYIYISIIFVFILVFIIPVPYSIEIPGGLIDVNDKITMTNEKYTNTKGSLNLTYVTTLDGNVLTFLTSIFNRNWDAISIKNDDYNEKDNSIRNSLMLENSLYNAYYAAYTYLEKEINIVSSKVYVAYISNDASTNLSVGDQILKVDGKEIDNSIDYSNIVNTKKVGDKLNIVTTNGEKYIEVKEKDGKNNTLIYIICNNKYDVNDFTFDFDKSESGPSGGLMVALSIYDKLVDFDLTNGLVVAGTGTIDMDGNVGEISGIKYKIVGAGEQGADIFLVPKENYVEAYEVKKINGYDDMKLVPVETFSDAVKYLEEYEVDK